MNKELQEWADSLIADNCSIKEWDAYQRGLAEASLLRIENGILKRALISILNSDKTSDHTREVIQNTLKETENNETKRSLKTGSSEVKRS